jgi:hypothetical protein
MTPFVSIWRAFLFARTSPLSALKGADRMSIEQFKALGKSLPKYREWRAAQIGARPAPVESVREVVKYVDRIVEVSVEQDTSKLEAAVERMRTAAENLEKPGKKFKFNVSALQDERFPKETLAETDERLGAELADLEARLANIAKAGLDRHTELSGKLYKKVGA